MAELIKCKSCGFIMEKSRLKDKCPACGVDAKMFEDYDSPVSESRRRIMNLHIHPILVHFSVAFCFSLLVLITTAIFVKGDLLDDISSTVMIMSFFFPMVLILSFISGVYDGKIRFKKVTRSPLLKLKMIIGSMLFVLSVILFAGVMKAGLASPLSAGLLAGLSAACLALVIPLSLWGTSMLDSKFPG